MRALSRAADLIKLDDGRWQRRKPISLLSLLPTGTSRSCAGVYRLSANGEWRRKPSKLMSATCASFGFSRAAPWRPHNVGTADRPRPGDVRAFMAARRIAGIGSRSLLRSLAGMRSFARFLERDGNGALGALAAVRAPKVAKTLPKALPISAANGSPIQNFGQARTGELGACARRCRARLALWLRPADFRGARSQASGPARSRCRRCHYRHRQGQQEAHGSGVGAGTSPCRRLPRRAVLTNCLPRGRSSSVPGAGRSHRGLCSLRWRAYAGRWACRRRRRRTRCGIPLRRIFSHAGATFARFKNCSGTPRFRPRKSIPRSILTGCWTFIESAHPRA